IEDLKLPAEMKDLAHVIIQRKAGHFRPEEFTDRYEDALVELIRAKQAGMPARPAEQPARPSNVVNIMDALRNSIAAAGGALPAAAKPGGKAPAASAPARPKAPSKFKAKAAEPASSGRRVGKGK
ncbi:MAG TPA: Ku protein, partial [Roseiarcus sp.]|nr:Ku protein [Roseiarcus sp.]